MIKYYCNACGSQVRSLGDLTDLRSQNSSKPHDARLAFDGNFQDHICTACVNAIRHFIATLNVRPAPPTTKDDEITRSGPIARG